MFKSICYVFVLLMLFSFSIYGQTVSTIVTNPSMDFEAVHWHPDGRIYVTDYINGKLYKVDFDGSSQTVVSGFSAIAGGGFDRAGNFYFAGINVGKMYRLNDDNTYDEVGSGYNQPVAFLQSDTDDNIAFISAYGSSSVYRLDLTTNQSTLFASNSGINGPDGMIYDNSGNILIANYNNHQINKIDDDGSVSLFKNIPSGGVMGYLVRHEDNIYVCSITAKKIYRINGEGDIEHIAGSGVSGSVDGDALDASFQGPNGIAINATGDTILVGDNKTIRMITNFKTTGIKKHNLELLDFVASPNPVQDQFEVSYNYPKAFDLSFEILSFEGKRIIPLQTIRSQEGKNRIQIDCSTYPKGLYFIRLVNEEGRVYASNFYKS